MKNLLLLLYFFSVSSLSIGQEVMFSHNYYHAFTVFYDNTILREKASINSSIIAKVKSGTQLEQAYQTVKGEVGGIKGVWHKIRYKGSEGYVWGELITNCFIKSQENPSYSFLINGRNGQTEVKIFHEGRLDNLQTMLNPKSLRFSGVKSMGKTYHSGSKDVFMFYYGDYKDSQLKFYTWNNKKFEEFNQPFRDSSFLNYNRKSEQLIIEKLVNFRKEPTIQSSVISVLEMGNKVAVLQENVAYDTVGGVRDTWTKVKLGKDTGYIWGPFVSLYQFASYKEEGLTFLIRKFQGYRDQLIAIKENKILDTFSFQGISNFLGAHSYGNMGLDNVEDIIGVCYSGESCGVPSGDVLISWSNQQFKSLTNDYGIGDGGLSYGHNVVFPSSYEGQRGMIKITESDSESIDLYCADKGENNYESIYETILTRNYMYLDGKLKEIESETNKIERLLASQFKHHQLNYYVKEDFNKDGRKDVILYAIDTLSRTSENYYERKNKSLIVVALGQKRGGYKILTSSNKLITHGANRPLTKVISTEQGFCIKIYYSGYYNEESDPRHFYMYYQYNKKKRDFLLNKIEEYFPPTNYSGTWEKQEHFYKKNPLLFKNSYHPELYSD